MINQQDINEQRKEKAKILIAQSQWGFEQISNRDANQCWVFEPTTDYEKFINTILSKAKNDKVDLVVFPEFSIPEFLLPKIEEWSKENDCVVVAGSTYLEREGKFYNTCSIYHKGTPYKTEKAKLSPYEVSSITGMGPTEGTEQLYLINSPVGKLGIMICADEFSPETRTEFLKLNLDILCVIAFQNKAKEHHQSINEIIKESKEGIYVAYCNALCDSLADGGSALFGNRYPETHQEYTSTGLTRSDGIDFRLIEMPPNQGCLIVECDLNNKLVTYPKRDGRRSNVEVERPFVYENNSLRQLTIEELIGKKTEKEKQTKKEEYQPTIPPVKTFTSAYIGRQEDNNFLKEFLNNKEKHFLLLYGVGGMGKSHLLYECIKNYKGKPFYFHAVSPNEEFTLNKLYELCLLPKPDEKKSIEEKQNELIEKFQQGNVHLILDDYYEVQLPEVKTLLPKLIGIGKGKLLILSRIIPSNINHLQNDFLSRKILPLSKENFKTVIQSYAAIKNVLLTDDDIHRIYEKAQGYPLGGHLIVDAKPYSSSLEELLSDICKYEAELDPEGKDYSGRLLNRIFQKGEPQEIKLLCEFSALFGSSEIETIKQLPSYNLRLFEGLHDRKGFIDRDAQNKFSSHAMIRDFAYSRLQKPKGLHLKMANYFEKEISGRTDEDWKNLNDAILHYSKTQKEDLSSFKIRVERKFESRNIKGIIDKSSRTKTIRNYLTLINLYPDRPAYYNELGIAYRLNRQHSNAIETFLRALEIEPTNVKILNALGITYRENNQKAKAIETFLRALEIEPTNVKILNALGITYRENNQKAKAIETFLRALEIEPKALPSLNALGITYRENNQKAKAIETFLRALEIDEKHLPSLNALGITYRENNQKAKAIETFLRALEIEPTNVKILNALGITYRENNQKAKAIETFLRALEIDEKHLPSLNELGITYRENNQKAKAIETFLRALEIDEKHLPSLNELGITYRENNQIEDAIKICNDALKISEQGTIYLNLLQIHLLFKPNHQEAENCFIKVFVAKYIPKSLKDSKKKYLDVLNSLESIWNISMQSNSDYKNFLQLAIQYKSYSQTLLILTVLNNKFPNDSKIKSGLGKTLSNSVIGKYEEGQKYLREAIELFKAEHNAQQLQSHIIYYLYNLINHAQAELLEKEFKRLEADLVKNADYFRFRAHYSFYENQNFDSAINYFEQAIEVASENDKREFVESLLRFLDEKKKELHNTYFKKYESIL